MEETQALGQNLLITGLGVFALFTFGIVVVTYVQEFVRSKMRNGKGNQRSLDNNWPIELLKEIGATNSRLERIERIMTNDLAHLLNKIINKLDNKDKTLEREVR